MTEEEQHSTELKLSVPWGYIAAKAHGSSTGKLVLMVHGMKDNSGAFTRLLKYLPMENYYVCPDLPGHGYSSRFPSWVMADFFNYIQAIYYIIEALQWKTCIYVGHSFGAQIGIAFSIIQPHRIEKIIAFDGLIPLPPLTKETFMKTYKDLFTLPIIAKNLKENLYTEEEILYALKNLRSAVLNTDAAKVMFDRAVTEVNGKYKYTRDPRLKRKLHTLLTLEQLIYLVSNISVPFYLFFASQSVRTHISESMFKVISSINPKCLSQLCVIKGNHDFHNNIPKQVAPFICEILQNENLSKL